MARLHSTKVVYVKAERQCYGHDCGKKFAKGTKMLAQKYFPDNSQNKCPYQDMLCPTTIYVCRECVIAPKWIELMDNHK